MFSEWIKDTEPEAYGLLELSPAEFGQMTFREYQAKLKGYQRKIIYEAKFLSLAINDPKQLNELEILAQLREAD